MRARNADLSDSNFSKLGQKPHTSRRGTEEAAAHRAARVAAPRWAKSALSRVPALHQEGSVNLLLLTPRLFHLICAVLPGTQRFKNLALCQRPLIGLCRFLAQSFQAVNFVLHLNTQLLQLLTQKKSKVKIRSHASGRERAQIDLSRLFQEAVKPDKSFLGPCHMQRSLLQGERPLVFETLAKLKQRRKRKTKSHNRQPGSAISRSSDSCIPATSCVLCVRNSRSAGMSAIARSRSGSLPFW